MTTKKEGSTIKLSIITPYYKTLEYTKKLAKIIEPQLTSECEWIIVDDGCNEIELDKLKAKVIHQENGGVSNARNKGLDIAKGEYIVFIDSDDIVKQNYIEVILNKINEEQFDYCFFSWEATGRNKGQYIIKDHPESWNTSVWNCIYKRETVGNSRFPEDKQIGEEIEFNKEKAHSPQVQNIKTQLLKLGGSIFESDNVTINMQDDWFIPSSILSDMRRRVVDALANLREVEYLRPERKMSKTGSVYPVRQLTYLGNVMNSQARTFYQDHGVMSVDDAFEKTPVTGVPIMFCKHCLRYAFGWCPKYQKDKSPYNEPYYLITNDGRRFELRFDCKRCQMEIIN